MNIRPASQTAIRVAAQRAVHQILDGTPKILDDTLIVGLIPETSEAVLRGDQEYYLQPSMKRLRALFVLRSRFAEDRLEEAVHRGMSQYIVLGAGLDTFGYRRPKWGRALNVIEVDHPASQNYKIMSLSKAGVYVPANTSYFPIDFENENMTSRIREAPWNRASPIFVSWLGVTMYLNLKATLDTLTWVSSWSPKSEIVLTYIRNDWSDLDAHSRKSMEDAEKRSAAIGEPWLSKFSPGSMTKLLSDSGFSEIEHLDMADAERRYFSNRTDGLVPGGGNGMVWARS